MSILWRIFKVKSKNCPESGNKSDSSEDKNDIHPEDLPPNLERRSRGNRMSVSRSGRFKQRSHRRSALFDNPNLSAKRCENDENCVPESSDDDGVKRVAENEPRRNSACKQLPLQSAV